MRHAIATSIGLVLVLVGCGSSDPVASSAPAPMTQAADMCAEHGVLEALCTRCNPALIPVFQGKGDWCAEHELPESICPICHPERGGRPPEGRDLAEDPSPPDGIRVRLASVEVGQVAGLHTVPIVQPSAEQDIAATAVIRYDATRVARLNARAEGVVALLAADVGAQVEVGAALAEIDSAIVGENQARLAAARARVGLARKQLARLEALARDGASSPRAVEDARGAAREAEGEVAALTAARTLVGPTDGQRYVISSPFAGVVTRQAAPIGAFVDREDLLFEVVDTRVMWADIEVAERDVGDIAIGDIATIIVDSLAERPFSAQVRYIAPEVDAHSRTVLVRAALDNADGLLRANMFARATLRVTRADATAHVLVPRAAVQAAKDVSLVFVQVAPDTYEGRRVTLGRAHPGGLVEVAGRFVVGERVVDEGAFILKTETLKDSIGAGCCADEGGK